MKRKSYNIISFDVWGNEEDGFDINDCFTFRNNIVMECQARTYNKGTPHQFTCFYPTDKEILAMLIDEKFLKSSCVLTDLDIDNLNENDVFITEAINGYPVCEMRMKSDHCDIDGNPID